jgi:hypothetical protein
LHAGRATRCETGEQKENCRTERIDLRSHLELPIV